MPVFCAALGCGRKQCKKERALGYTFHRFPQADHERKKLWVKNLNRDGFSPSKIDVLCSDHFKDEYKIWTGTLVRLTDDAIPTVFQFPTPLQKVDPGQISNSLLESVSKEDLLAPAMPQLLSNRDSLDMKEAVPQLDIKNELLETETAQSQLASGLKPWVINGAVSQLVSVDESLETKTTVHKSILEENPAWMITTSVPKLMSVEDSLGMKVPMSQLVSEEDPLEIKVPMAQLVSEEDPLEMKVPMSQLVSEEDPLGMEVPVARLVSEEDPPEMKVPMVQLVSEEDPLEMEVPMCHPVSEEDPLRMETPVSQLVSRKDPLRIVASVAPLKFEADPLKTKSIVTMPVPVPHRDPLEMETTQMQSVLSSSRIQCTQDLITRSLYQNCVEALSVKYYGRESFETFFSEHLCVSGNKEDRLNFENSYKIYLEFCNKNKTLIAEEKHIIRHLACLGIHITNVNEERTDQKHLLGLILMRPSSKVVKKIVLCSPGQGQDLNLFQANQVLMWPNQTVSSCKDISLRSVLPTFPWNYMGQVSFETFCFRHLTITYDVGHKVNQNNLLSAYTEFCHMNNYPVAMLVSIVFHLWFLGIVIKEYEDSYKFCGLVMVNDETSKTKVDDLCKTAQYQFHAHLFGEVVSSLGSDPLILANILQNPGELSFYVFLKTQLHVTGDKRNSVNQNDLLSAYISFCNQRDLQAADLKYIRSCLKEMGVFCQYNFSFVGLVLLHPLVRKISSFPKNLHKKKISMSAKRTGLYDQNHGQKSSNSCLVLGRSLFDDEETDEEKYSLLQFLRKKIKLTGDDRDVVSKDDLLSAYTVFCQQNNLPAASQSSAIKHLYNLGYKLQRQLICGPGQSFFSGLVLSNLTIELRLWRKGEITS